VIKIAILLVNSESGTYFFHQFDGQVNQWQNLSSAEASIFSPPPPLMYFKWSGELAIRNMQCIPSLFLYDTLQLYYTSVGLLARLLILLPYINPVCQLQSLVSSSLLMSSKPH
jgi:hypothetical protein